MKRLVLQADQITPGDRLDGQTVTDVAVFAATDWADAGVEVWTGENPSGQPFRTLATDERVTVWREVGA